METVQTNSEIVKVAIAKLISLEGDTFDEKKKSVIAYLKNLNLSSQELDEFGHQLVTNKPCMLCVDILRHFKMHRHVLEIIKSGNILLLGRILKDWTFFKNIFTYVTPEELVNTVLPLLSFTIRMKIINRICKTLTDKLIANLLFELLEDKYGITTASVLIPACSVTLIKSNIVKYDLKLSNRNLWMIYKQDPTFIEYYFAHRVDVMKEKSFVHDYNHLLKRILNSNSILFWCLIEKYKIPIKIGKNSSKKLLTDRDVMLKYAFEKNSSVTFTKRQTYLAAVNLGVQKEYLLSFYPGNLDDFLNNSLNAVPSLQKFVPRNQRFTLTNAIFKEKYSDDLFNYPIYFNNSSLLELLTISERETILDKLEDKEDLLYFYGIEKSVPMLKEKLHSASDLKIRTKLIFMLFKTCNVNNSNNDLLDILNVLYNRYRNDTLLLAQFMNNLLTTWKEFKTLQSEHWDVIYKILKYLNISNKDIIWKAKNTCFREYFKFLVDNNECTDEFLETIVNEGLQNSYIHNEWFISLTPKYEKIFYERTKQILKRKSEHKFYKSVCINLLQNVIVFNRKHRNYLNLADYTYLLDFCDIPDRWYDGTFIDIINKFGICHENIWKYYANLNADNFSRGFYTYCINKSPKDLLKIDDLYSKISRLNYNIFDLFNCPFLKDSFSAFKASALTELNSDKKYLNREFSMKFLCLLDENEFLNYSKRFDPPEDGKIPPDFDTTHLEIQKSIVKCLPLVSYPQNTIILTKYCKGDYLKFALPSLYKILFGTANIHVEDFLRNMYKSEVSVRKHSLCLGRHLLSPKLFGNFLEMVNNQENNLSLRFVFLKKALECFIETHDDKFYHFFLANLDKVDDKDHSVFDYITKYSRIPKSYLLDYIKHICQKISVNSDKYIKQKKFAVLNSLPDYFFENLDTDFITWCFEDNFFEITPFAIKCLFNSESVDNSQLIFEKFKSFLSGGIQSQNCRSNISGFVQEFCEQALQKKAVDKFTMFYSSCQQAFPEYSLINARFLIDFTQKWFESHEDVKHFAIKINKYLIDSVKLYTHSIISGYSDELKAFMANATIDEFEFVQNFFYMNSLDETYIATINLLPNRMPDVKNAYRMYIPLLEALEKIRTPVVIAHLDLYYGRVH